MKKLFALIGLILLISFTSCSSDDSTIPLNQSPVITNNIASVESNIPTLWDGGEREGSFKDSYQVTQYIRIIKMNGVVRIISNYQTSLSINKTIKYYQVVNGVEVPESSFYCFILNTPYYTTYQPHNLVGFFVRNGEGYIFFPENETYNACKQSHSRKLE